MRISLKIILTKSIFQFRILILCCLLFFVTNSLIAQQSYQKKPFELWGTVSGKATSKKIYLSFRTLNPNDEPIIDSTVIVNNKFIFKGFINEPKEAFIYNSRKESSNSSSAILYLEPKKLDLIIDYNNFNTAKLKGSKTHDEYSLLQKLCKIPIKTRDSIGQLYRDYYDKINAATDSLLIKELNSKVDKLDTLWEKSDEQINEIEFAFIKQNPSSFVSPSKLLFILGRTDVKHFETLNSLYNILTKFIQNSESGKELNKKLKTISTNIAGSKAPDFTVSDSNGKLFSLNSYQNKSCVLLEFWASWCSPCREGIPELKNLYSKYNNQGFEIIGITIDEKLESWKKAIIKDKIENWKHFSYIENQKSFEKLYYVQAIPQKILINKEGIIVGRWVGESPENQLELKKILSETFKD